MQTSQGCGTRHLHLWTPVLPSHEVVGTFSMQDALSLGPPNFNPKLHCPLLKLSTLQCHKLYVTSFLSWDYYSQMREQDFKVLCTKPYVYCKVFEDNSGTLKLARLPMLRPRTKHINVSYHHFREHVRKGLIKIFPIDTKDQIADALTKPLAQNNFQRHHHLMCGK